MKREDYKIIESFKSLPSADDTSHDTVNENDHSKESDKSDDVSKSKLAIPSKETCVDKKDDDLLQCNNHEFAKVDNGLFEQSVDSFSNKPELEILAPSCVEGPRQCLKQPNQVTGTQTDVNNSLNKSEPEFLATYNEGPSKSQKQCDLVTDTQRKMGSYQPSNDCSWQISDTIPGLLGFSISTFKGMLLKKFFS